VVAVGPAVVGAVVDVGAFVGTVVAVLATVEVALATVTVALTAVDVDVDVEVEVPVTVLVLALVAVAAPPGVAVASRPRKLQPSKVNSAAVPTINRAMREMCRIRLLSNSCMRTDSLGGTWRNATAESLPEPKGFIFTAYRNLGE